MRVVYICVYSYRKAYGILSVNQEILYAPTSTSLPTSNTGSLRRDS